MPRKRDDFSPSREKPMPMTGVEEARGYLLRVPRDPLARRGDWLRTTARTYGLTYSQAKKLFYGEVKTITSDQLDFMRGVAGQLRARVEARRDRINEIAQRIADARAAAGIPAADE